MPTTFSFKNFYKNQTILPTTNIAHQRQSKTQLSTSFTRAYKYLIECLGRVLTVAATATRDGVVYLWAEYNQRVAFVEEHVVMPRSGLSFIVTALLAFAAMKCQCLPGFPFVTHRHQVSSEAQGIENDSTTTTIKAITTAHMVESILLQNFCLISGRHCRPLTSSEAQGVENDTTTTIKAITTAHIVESILLQNL